ncbi:MAG: hypothetical protein LBD99_03570 [Candidatus Margulisbacteria bacterium]|jgi:hypothetical protein|nr:hypothetical protein [Candidatus Margulisiibacteriota bacterium]
MRAKLIAESLPVIIPVPYKNTHLFLRREIGSDRTAREYRLYDGGERQLGNGRLCLELAAESLILPWFFLIDRGQDSLRTDFSHAGIGAALLHSLCREAVKLKCRQLIIQRTPNYGLMNMVYEKISKDMRYQFSYDWYNSNRFTGGPERRFPWVAQDLLRIVKDIYVIYPTGFASPRLPEVNWRRVDFLKRRDFWWSSEPGLTLEFQDSRMCLYFINDGTVKIPLPKAQFYFKSWHFDLFIPLG